MIADPPRLPFKIGTKPSGSCYVLRTHAPDTHQPYVEDPDDYGPTIVPGARLLIAREWFAKPEWVVVVRLAAGTILADFAPAPQEGSK